MVKGHRRIIPSSYAHELNNKISRSPGPSTWLEESEEASVLTIISAAEKNKTRTQLEVHMTSRKIWTCGAHSNEWGGWDFESSIDFKYPNGKRDDCQTNLRNFLEEVLSSGKELWFKAVRWNWSEEQ